MSKYIAASDLPFYLKVYTDGFFNIDGTFGFLPTRDPLAVVPKEYNLVQCIVSKMPIMVKGISGISNEIEICVDRLPNYSDLIDKESDIFRVQSLYRAYSFIASAYCLEPVQREFVISGNHGKARNFLPINISKPLSILAEKIGAYPWLDYYYAYTIGNYIRINPDQGLHWKNQTMAIQFCGSSDEVGFNATHVYINEVTPDLVGSVYKVGKGEEVKDSLKRCGDALKEVNNRRKEMWAASQSTKFNDFRNFLMGITGNEALFGAGVIFDQCYNQEPQQFRGASGAQDSIIPMLDIFTGIVDFYPNNELTQYLMDLRAYRPKCLQDFLVDLRTYFEENPVFASLVANKQYEELVYFLRVVDEIYLFRNGHWQFVQKYIMSNTKHDRGTGGTPVTTWLMNQIGSVLTFYKEILEAIEPNVASLVDPEVINVYTTLQKGFSFKVKLLETQKDLLKGGLSSLDIEKMHRSNSLDDESSEGLKLLQQQQCPAAGECPFKPRTETF